MLETGDVPILFSLPQVRNLGTTFELNPQEDKITCPTFGLCSSPAEHSTKGHIVLDLTRKQPHEEGRTQAIDDEDLPTSGSSETFETSTSRTAAEENGTTAVVRSNCYAGTRCAKGLARVNRGDLDLGQRQNVKHSERLSLHLPRNRTIY